MQLTKEYLKASNGAANPSLMTVQSIRSAGASAIITNTVAGAPPFFIATMGTPHTFTDPVTSEVITIISEASAVDFAGHIDTGHVEIDEIAPGYTDLGSKVGDIIIIRPTTRWGDLISEYISPTGVINPFAGTVAPSNWLLCDGASLLRTDYPRLFAVIGTTFGAADGTHFNVPDLRSRAPIGVGTGVFNEVIAQGSAVNTTTDVLTVSAAGGKQLTNGAVVQVSSSGTLPTGLVAATNYYVIAVTSTTIKLASSLANAIAGTAIDITAVGSGNMTIALTLSARALGDRGGEEAHPQTNAELSAHTHSIGGGQNQWVRGGTGDNAASLTQGGSAFRVVPGDLDSKGGGAAANVMQPYLALNYIIKT